MRVVRACGREHSRSSPPPPSVQIRVHPWLTSLLWEVLPDCPSRPSPEALGVPPDRNGVMNRTLQGLARLGETLLRDALTGTLRTGYNCAAALFPNRVAIASASG
jgi:hypothetical protein